MAGTKERSKVLDDGYTNWSAHCFDLRVCKFGSKLVSSVGGLSGVATSRITRHRHGRIEFINVLIHLASISSRPFPLYPHPKIHYLPFSSVSIIAGSPRTGAGAAPRSPEPSRITRGVGTTTCPPGRCSVSCLGTWYRRACSCQPESSLG